MKLLYVFKERAPIFIELAWRMSSQRLEACGGKEEFQG